MFRPKNQHNAATFPANKGAKIWGKELETVNDWYDYYINLLLIIQYSETSATVINKNGLENNQILKEAVTNSLGKI